MIRAVVLDVEGTTSSTAFVYDTLYPYARERFLPWLRSHRGEPRVERVLSAIRSEAGDPDLSVAQVVRVLERWADEDRKVTALKAVQGWIWDEGFSSGDLRSHFYPDAVPALGRWREEGRLLAVFSSGSVTAQRAWFAHSPDGDLTPLVSDWFDTENAGPKRDPDSYGKIGEAIATLPAETAFLSDVGEELDAARAAGWRTVGIRRPGERWYAAGVGDHPEAASFDDAEAYLR